MWRLEKIKQLLLRVMRTNSKALNEDDGGGEDKSRTKTKDEMRRNKTKV